MNDRILIVTPLQSEFIYLAESLSFLGFDSYQDNIGKLDVLQFPKLNITLARGGHGKTQFAIHTQYLLDRSQNKLLICAGTAGALSRNISIGDVIVATSIIEHDYHEKFSIQSKPQFFGHEESISRIRSLHIPNAKFNVHFGVMASGDEDVIDVLRGTELHQLHGALAVAWEGAGGARACAFNEIPYLELRGITDNANHTAPEAFEANLKIAMHNIAHIVVQFCFRFYNK
jgi:adenosylhomocysteine nucleosidase